MNLRQIEVFRAVMMAGTVTDAARLLHVSQPGISRMLGHIELQLGLKLFDRRRGKLQPTPEAQVLYAEVAQAYQGVQRIDQCARELQQGRGLSLRVLCSPSLGFELVPQAITALAQRYPEARLYLETSLVREMVLQLTRREADVAVCTLPIDHALLQGRPIGRWSLACVMRPDHPLAARRTIGLRELGAERVIAFSPDTPQGRLIAEHWQANGLTPSHSIEVRSGQVACALAAAGAGVAVVDEWTARAWNPASLVARPLRPSPTHGVFLVQAAHAPESAVVSAFEGLLRAAFKTRR